MTLFIEEINIVSLFPHDSREECMREMESSLPFLSDKAVEAEIRAILKKLSLMRDEDFNEIFNEIAPEVLLFSPEVFSSP